MAITIGLLFSVIYGQNKCQSQLLAYYQGSYNQFTVENSDARMINSGEKSLSLQLLPKSKSDKVLLILNESWGFTNNPALEKAVIGQILANKDRFEYLEYGKKAFGSVTLQAEIKELCQRALIGLDTDNLTKEDFANCLPHLMQKRGYSTYGLHGSTGSFYKRANWYPKAGFQHQQFLEDMPQLPRCGTFNGVCDQALFPLVKNMLLAQPKSFVHWMTLTTHYPYEAKDIQDRRLQCTQFGLKEGSTACRNLMLQSQFFDQLALWIQDPQLSGLEVVVVGDHEPPLFDAAQSKAVFQLTGISWLHFKIK